jgi:hypothetical protein
MSTLRTQRSNVRYWHKADITIMCLGLVVQGYSVVCQPRSVNHDIMAGLYEGCGASPSLAMHAIGIKTRPLQCLES